MNAGSLYHARLKQVLLMGGGHEPTEQFPYGIRGDPLQVWAWNGTRWQLLAKDGPPDRGQPAVAYDSARDRVVLYGGVQFRDNQSPPVFMTDTWTWDGVAWTQLADSAPKLRNSPVLGYDPQRNVSVLFGSIDASSAQTWELDGAMWKRIDGAQPPAPPEFDRTYSFTYDPTRKMLVLAGGFPTLTTWTYDGKWTRVAGADLPFANGISTFHPALGKLVLFGGTSGPTTLADTYVLDGATWTKLAVSGPPPRAGGALVADPARGIVVLYSAPARSEGSDGPIRTAEAFPAYWMRSIGQTTWEFDGRAWTKIP